MVWPMVAKVPKGSAGHTGGEAQSAGPNRTAMILNASVFRTLTGAPCTALLPRGLSGKNVASHAASFLQSFPLGASSGGFPALR